MIQSGHKFYDHLQKFGSCNSPATLANYIFKVIFVEENIWVWIQISLKFVHEGPIGNKSGLVQVMDRQQTATP